MTYTATETTRITLLLDVFQDYIQTSPHIDVVTSPKFGYIFLLAEENYVDATRLNTAEELFERLLREVSNDVRDLFLCGQHMNASLFLPEIVECRRRMQPYLEQLPDALKTLYTAQMEFFFNHCNDIYQCRCSQ